MKTTINTTLKMLAILLVLAYPGRLFSTEDPEIDYSEEYHRAFVSDSSSTGTPEVLFKFGIGTDFSKHINFVMDMSFNTGTLDLSFLIRYFSEGPNWFFGESLPKENAYFMGFSIGKKSVGKGTYFYPSIGIGYIGGVVRGDYLYTDGYIFGDRHYEKKDISDIALPLAIDIGFDFGGVGLSLMNEYIVSMDKSYYNCSLNLCLFMK